MAFDISTARPIDETEVQQPKAQGFDLSTAQPVDQMQAVEPQVTEQLGQKVQPQLIVDDDLPRFRPEQFTPEAQQRVTPQPKQPKSSALDVIAEGASAVNRGVTQLADFLTTDQVNAVLELAGSDLRVPTITESLSAATRGGQMQPGLARDVVRTAGELIAPGAATGAAVRGAIKSLPAAKAGESALTGTLRSLGAGTTAGGDIVASAASGVGSELGEEVAGTPGAIAGSVLAPTAVLGAKQGLQRLAGRIGRTVPIVGNDGLPTKEFDAALKSRKLDIADITDDIDSLPLEIKPKNAKEVVDNLVKVKLDKGDSAPALATIRLSGPPAPRAQAGELRLGAFLKDKKIVPDDLGKKAVSVGFVPGEVASAKGGNDVTRAEMRKMLNLHRQIYRDASKAAKYNRPSNVAGKIVQKKIDFAMDRAANLRDELDDIAKRKLKGQTVNFDDIQNKVFDQIRKLRVDIPDEVTDITSLKAHLSKKESFTGSNIKESEASQRLIRKTLSVLEDAANGSAENTHFVKRQIDAFLDDAWGETPGLKNAGTNFAKSVRKITNEAVRDVDERYKQVNQDLSRAIDVKDQIQKYITKKTDLKNTGLAEKKIGNELRKLFSNYQVGSDIDETLSNLDDLVLSFQGKQSLGDVMDVDVQRLIQFSTTLDNRFGPVAAPRSYKGETASGTKLGILSAGAETASDIAVSPVLGTARGARKVLKSMTTKKQNDLEAYNVMQKLLKRGK